MTRVACIDIGSTFTKGALVDVDTGDLIHSTSHPTTLSTDVLDGVENVRSELGRHDEVLACSSAGGGLRLAVVGYERVVTAEAGHRVALSAGARVAYVSAGPLDESGVSAVVDQRPDVILLVGGTDGGNADVLLHNARELAASGLAAPIVVAGNLAVRDKVVQILAAGGRTAIPTDNVLPQIGRLEPRPARSAIRDVFIRHVIGGKGLSRRPAELSAMVRAATPDAVLAGVEAFAAVTGDLLVVDVGGATTDVYSVLDPEHLDAEETGDVAGAAAALRTVEGDLGMRWNAPGVVAAAASERLLDARVRAGLERLAAARAADPGWLPMTDDDWGADQRLARLAVTVALRRHARGGRDLRRVQFIIGSGGVLRHAHPSVREAILEPATTDHAGGWRVPERARVSVDERYVLAAAGLLATEYPEAATRLLSSTLVGG